MLALVRTANAPTAAPSTAQAPMWLCSTACARLLSPEGLMILTAPYGTRAITELERIYDEESLSKLLADWEVLERQIVVRRDALVWEADDDVEPGARGVVMLIASPKQP